MRNWLAPWPAMATLFCQPILPLQPGSGEFAVFAPGQPAKIAFAIWEGSNAERAGQKAVSGIFTEFELEA